MANSNEVQAIPNKTSLTTFTPQLSRILAEASEPAAVILKARFSGIMFKDMNQSNLTTSAKLIIADLKVLTGLKIPLDKAYERMLVLFAETLQQDYPLYTVPLMQMAVKKHCTVLTTGKEKSYGRDLGVTDLHQIMDAFLSELKEADTEIEKIEHRHIEERNLQQDEKENILRELIEETYQSENYDSVTYATFNQFLKDGIIKESSLKNVAWQALNNLKAKYHKLSADIVVNSENLRGLTEKRNYQEKLELIELLQQDIKAEVARMYMQHAKENGRKNIYISDKE